MTGTDACVRCGLCLPSCPTYVETLTETSGPRGRIRLMGEVESGHLDLLSPGFVHQMYECLDCRACEAACPSGVPYGALVESARASIEAAREPQRGVRERAQRRFLVRTLFSSPRLLRLAARLTRIAQRTGAVRLASAVGLGDAAGIAPEIPAESFDARDQWYGARDDVGTAFLHVGCIMPLAFPHVHHATVRMLGRARLNVTVPKAQGCCGAIAVHAGDPDTAREMAKTNIVAFERSGADVYVSNAAGCGSTLKEYAHLFADDESWRERARRFSARVRDCTEVLDASELDPAIGRLDVTVTYQEPCHLVHAQRVSAAPRRLLQRIPGLQLIEMEESALCCGSAGVYNLTQPDMARRLQQRKVSAILATTADVVATANPGCALQVSSGLRDKGAPKPVRHIVELLDEAYANYAVAVTRP